MLDRLFAVATTMLLSSCIGDLPGASCPDLGVSFAEHVVPIIGRDCSSCHSKGEDGVRLRGEDGDYPEVMRYVVPWHRRSSTFLEWASGERGFHPATWPRGSEPLACAATWIDEGACDVCEVPTPVLP
jgi:hypothetical protein